MVVLALALGACGGAASLTTITRSDAASVARAINLRKSDLPGYSEKSPQRTPPDPAASAALLRCLHQAAAGAKVIGKASSPDFAGPGIEGTPRIRSSVAVWSSTAALQRRLKSFARTRSATCLDRDFDSYLSRIRPKGITLSPVQTIARPPLVHDTEAAFTFRLVITVHTKALATEAAVSKRATETTASVYVDLAGFYYRQIAVALVVETLLVPPRLSLEQPLARLLLARARDAVGQ
jgi:hypothetical protein